MGFFINSKHEARNPKQIRKTKILNSKRDESHRYWVTVWNVSAIWPARNAYIHPSLSVVMLNQRLR